MTLRRGYASCISTRSQRTGMPDMASKAKDSVLGQCRNFSCTFFFFFSFERYQGRQPNKRYPMAPTKAAMFLEPDITSLHLVKRDSALQYFLSS